MKTALWLIPLTLLAFVVRFHNLRETFIEGRIYFVDGDCYSRMSRARIIDENPGTIIHHHDFENFPAGVDAHTTAPLDYLIVGIKRGLDLAFALSKSTSEYRNQSLDLAGALVSPILGALTCLYLGCWARWGLVFPAAASRWPQLAAAAPLSFALSPIAIHGTILGRPDHQSLLVFLLAIAFTAEWSLMSSAPVAYRRLFGIFRRSGPPSSTLPAKAEEGRPPEAPVPPPRALAITAGLAWGLSLWVSYFEPLILFLAMIVVVLLFDWGRVWTKSWLWEISVVGGVVGLALLLEGSPIPHLPPETLHYFQYWARSIGELNHLSLGKPLLYRWLGGACLASPLLLGWAARLDRRALAALAILLLTFGLTMDHLRWGYFLSLAYSISLPWQLAVLQRRWLAWTLYLLSLYPTMQEIDEIFFLSPNAQSALQEKRTERVLLREVGEHLRGDGVLPFLAPWWESPALAYWSDQPGIAGSSHEGLPGIVDSGRFYLATDPQEAIKILDKRHIANVVVDDPDRTIQTSSILLNIPPPVNPIAETLFRAPHSAPPFLAVSYSNPYFKIFSVDTTRIERER